jgi:dephospho-CoA kinase
LANVLKRSPPHPGSLPHRNGGEGTGGRVPVIGIVGGIGSGKSTLARWVAERHPVVVIDADRIGHQVLERPDVIERLRQHFGDAILNDRGQIDRSALAKRVFGTTTGHQSARLQLETVVHPEIQREIERQIAAIDANAVRYVLLDAAVLLESKWSTVCDRVVFVDTPDERRRKLVADNRGWSSEELARREASQWSLASKRAHADAVVLNDGTVAEGGERLWQAITG